MWSLIIKTLRPHSFQCPQLILSAMLSLYGLLNSARVAVIVQVYLRGFFALLMPYWLVYVSHVEDIFFNTPRL
jgi:hypothetical protein